MAVCLRQLPCQTVGNLRKVANVSTLSPAFSSCIIHTHFVEIQSYLEILLIDFCETLHVTEDKHPKFTQRKAFPKKMPIRAEIRFRAKTIVTSLSRDIYSDRAKNKIIIKFSLCVTHVL